ncbi:hypothetical protein JXR93_12690 [bacterium]|nr:hypothetical protein [bacterium]
MSLKLIFTECEELIEQIVLSGTNHLSSSIIKKINKIIGDFSTYALSDGENILKSFLEGKNREKSLADLYFWVETAIFEIENREIELQ